MKMQTKCTAAQRAGKYLKRIAALTGAEKVSDDTYRVRAGHRTFLVDYEFVRLISHHSKSTCFSQATTSKTVRSAITASPTRSNKLFPRSRVSPISLTNSLLCRLANTNLHATNARNATRETVRDTIYAPPSQQGPIAIFAFSPRLATSYSAGRRGVGSGQRTISRPRSDVPSKLCSAGG
jgi:hypothetical protein